MNTLESQSMMALIVWSVGSYQQGDDHFKANHLDTALENYKLLKNYIMCNEQYLREKENYKNDGSAKTPLLNANRRFNRARKKLFDFVKEKNETLRDLKS
ncbi:MAG: hypothetical protein KUA37_11980 [Desulfomicrobium sp.]|jgi:hypothetical protein|nr:hypothetical protein [Desulfomicrobium sp.]MBV1719426.1 hypothetical protein [Desulfomicrobium sp.]MBV1746536.1 hypothetical protein [Desulfomicrobium sp.]